MKNAFVRQSSEPETAKYCVCHSYTGDEYTYWITKSILLQSNAFTMAVIRWLRETRIHLFGIGFPTYAHVYGQDCAPCASVNI